MVDADELSRSLRAAAGLVNRDPSALSALDFSLQGFGRSFAALALTLPAYIVSLALARQEAGLGQSGALFDHPALAALVAAGHVAGFLAMPVLMIFVARRLGLGHRYVPFVVVTNWLMVFGSLALALPGALLLLGWETPALSTLFTVAFVVIGLHLQWRATRLTLGVGAGLAALLAAVAWALSLAPDALVQALA